MNIQETVSTTQKKQETSRFATLPSALQLEIKRYLELGDFKSAKALFDAGLPKENSALCR